MIILLKRNADKQQVDSLAKRMTQLNLQIHMSEGSSETIMGLVGDTSAVDIDSLMALDIVEDVKRIQEPYKNANRKFHPMDTVVEVGNARIGGGNFAFIAGPCSVESEEQICEVAMKVKIAGRPSCGAGPLSPEPRLTPFRACAKRALNCSSAPGRRAACPLLLKSWIYLIFLSLKMWI